MRLITLPHSKDIDIDSRAKQSERLKFAAALREAASVIEQRELRDMERMSLTHIEFIVEED